MHVQQLVGRKRSLTGIRCSLCSLLPSDCNVEKWCDDFHVNHGALLTADALLTELTDTLRRIELPVSVPAFGSRMNTINIKRALLAGFFMQVKFLLCG